ncbi:hypothetical protein [Streptomyces sp. NPDC086989]|uniref:hypothetical protein n=1 Tax=Streptomyces sp. NPDC086989 TaxID=3365764 RepID=UPI0037FE8EB0
MSVSAGGDGVLADPEYLQEGVHGLVCLLVRLGEPDIRNAERIAVVLADREAETFQPEQNDIELVQPVQDRSTRRRSRWATGCTGSASAPIIWNSGAECSQMLYW